MGHQGKAGQELKAGACSRNQQRNSAYWLAPWVMLNLPFYTVQAHLQRDGGTHSGLGFPSLIIHQKSSQQIQAVLQLRSQVCQVDNKTNQDSCFIYWEGFISLNITCLSLLPPFSCASSVILSPDKHFFSPVLCFRSIVILRSMYFLSFAFFFPVYHEFFEATVDYRLFLLGPLLIWNLAPET